MKDVNNMGHWGDGDIWELSMISAQFFCKPKLIRKISYINLKNSRSKKKRDINDILKGVCNSENIHELPLL